jgi:hypothetical protein
MSFGSSFFGFPRTVLADLEVDVSTLVADAVNDRIGIGDTAPGTTLQIKGEAPYVTLQNSTSENSDGGCEARIIFEDHADVALAQIEGSHNGSSDDTKGKLILSTHTGSSLTAALTINDTQQVIVPDGKFVLGSTAVGATASEINAVADASARTAAAIAVASDHFMFLDGSATGDVKVESVADLATAMAGTGLSASSGQLTVDSITSVGAVDSGSITSGFGAIDVGSSTITTTGNLSVGDATLTGGDIAFGNGQNATASVAATAHNAAGKNLTITAGPTTAGTTNNIAGGSLTIQGGQGKGSGAGGDIVFQTANAGGSGSSLNSLATALTISDDLSSTFAGDVIITDGNLKLGSTAVGATAAEINAACDASGRTAAAIAVADDHFLFCDGGATGATKVEAIADLMTAVAGTQATTGLTASSGTLVVTDLHPVGVSGSANQLLTDDGDGTVTSEAKCLVDGAKLTIGDATAEDTLLVFDGNAADWRMGIDDGTDVLEIGVGAAHGTTTAIGVNASAQTQVLAAFAANVAGTFGTFADGDGTPSVATGNLWKHHASTQTITMFDDGIAGQTIHVISTAAITYDVTSTNLKGGSTDIVTASGDITSWFFDGTNWYLIQFMDVSADMSSVGGGGGSTDLNGLDAAAVDVANDSIGIIDANDSNNSKKESIADLATAMAGTGLAASSGQLTVNAANTGTALASGGVRTTADQAGEVLAMQVFS